MASVLSALAAGGVAGLTVIMAAGGVAAGLTVIVAIMQQEPRSRADR